MLRVQQQVRKSQSLAKVKVETLAKADTCTCEGGAGLVETATFRETHPRHNHSLPDNRVLIEWGI